MDTLSCASVEGLLTKIKNLASRPIVEFNKYEVLDLLEALKNTARDVRHEKEGYFRLVYETLRENWTSLTRCSVVSCYHYWVTKIMKKS